MNKDQKSMNSLQIQTFGYLKVFGSEGTLDEKEIRLSLIHIQMCIRDSSNPDGTLSGETNLTIDAGIVQAYAIGDYVWLDTNCNGVQDDGEAGVPDVPVFLYKVGGADGEVQTCLLYTSRCV